MTTTTRQHDQLRAARHSVLEVVRAVEVRWEISPHALAASPAAAMILNGHAARMKSCTLVWRVGETASAALVMEMSGEVIEELPLLGAATLRRATDDATGMETIEVGDHRELLLVLRADASLAYARTSILTTHLALTGGVYDEPNLRT